MEQVCEMLAQIPADWAGHGGNREEDSMTELQAIIGRVSQLRPAIRYNRRILTFFLEQIERMRGITTCTDWPMECRLPVVHKLESLLLSSECMIKPHASRFDVLNFYTMSEARWVVQEPNGLHEDEKDADDSDPFWRRVA
ncbi:unnamed protein product [Ostreobium quekettii]|uniref:Uncharacterized protein n=1 Tax=Ostreobium quekettii TaxID=121088 RepID=A0A8S1JGH1_9CHLO|nr:unnamed protein product [Ostreobium quekettii]